MIKTIKLDDQLVVGAVRQEESSRSQVLEALPPQVRLMATARLSTTPNYFHAIEEITQLSMVAISDGLTRLQKPTASGLRAFASGIVSHKVSDYLNKRGGVDRRGASMASLDQTITSLSQSGPMWQFLSATCTSPMSVIDRTDQFRLLMAELGNLKPEHREVITLAFFDQLPTGEIAQQLGISRPAASMLLIRAVKTLRRNMTGSSNIGASHA